MLLFKEKRKQCNLGFGPFGPQRLRCFRGTRWVREVSVQKAGKQKWEELV